MSPPSGITGAQRRDVIEKARLIRKDMTEAQMRLASASMSLAAALNITSPDAAVNRLYVVKLLESLPGVGKVRARRVMSDIGIAVKCRVLELEPNQRVELLKELGQ